MLLYGRLANLILYLLLVALAVWLAPTSLRAGCLPAWRCCRCRCN